MNMNFRLTNRNINFTSAPLKKVVQKNIGKNTIIKVDSVRSLYEEISKKIESLTPEGRSFLEQQMPINLARGMRFDNVGKYKTSIVIRISDSLQNDGAMRIIERKSASKDKR